MFVANDVVKDDLQVYWNAYLRIFYMFVKAWDEALQYGIGTLHGDLLEVESSDHCFPRGIRTWKPMEFCNWFSIWFL